jgi:hypothetical protein
MLKKIIPLILMVASVLFVSSCQKEDEDAAFVPSASSSKAVVAVVPVIDNSHSDVSWSLSEEFTYAIYDRLAQKNQLFLIEAQKVRSLTKKLPENCNPFDQDLQWVKKIFSEDDFVVFLELVDHQETPILGQRKSSPRDCAAELNMTMRVRVLDIREAEPKIVLQELIHDSHHIPKQFTRFNFTQVAWGETTYSISPLGLAHAQFSKEIANRVTDYILIAKNKK